MADGFDAEYDVVVIGGGISGLMAALQVAQNGLSCVLLEKEAQTGGSSAFAEGHAAFESDEQRKRGIEVGKAEAYERYLDYSHWKADPAIISRFVENAATSIVKLREELGVVYGDVGVTSPDSHELRTWHLPQGGIASVVGLQVAEARRRGVDVFLESPAKQILMDAGRVTGVLATDSDGEEVSLGAKAVVVATGGFAASPEMLRKYTNYEWSDEPLYFGGAGNTGDGINMLLEVGAVTDANIGTLIMAPFTRGKTIVSETNCAGIQPYFWVNRNGRRFTNEAVTFNFGYAGDAVAAQPGSMYWAILSYDQIRKLVEVGNELGVGRYVESLAPLPGLQAEIDADVADPDRPGVRGAATIEELAEEIGVSAQVLRHEVDEYNGFCRAGKDPRFHKPDKYLRPLAQGPFYAVKMEMAVAISVGAMKVDDHLRALDGNDDPIPGLYVVGCDAGGLYGESYIVDIPGSANGFAVTSGWLAADDIAEQISAGHLGPAERARTNGA
jgi:fumarate reductase flavoprotein subunit